MPHNYESFDAMGVGLSGTNLIEASAGTGKTYSIAILVVRLVVEERVPIEQLLMVTFTKAAVAELEERIRRFVRSAYHKVEQESSGNDDIDRIVSAAISRDGRDAVRHRLNKAVLFLDETSVLTIHGFCQRVLSEFAFETGQVFGSEPLQDMAQVLADAVNAFWRREITTLPREVLALIRSRISREALQETVKAHLEGKQIFSLRAVDLNQVPDHEAWMVQAKQLEEAVTAAEAACLDHLKQHWEQYLARCAANSTAKRYFLDSMTSPEEVVALVRGKRDKKYIKAVFEDLLPLYEAGDKACEEAAAHTSTLLRLLQARAVEQVSQAVERYKKRNNLLAFDDMIGQLHRALTEGSRRRELVQALRRKYRAVFIDEFQDTDRQQYEIFNAAFGGDTLLFYIGDPKQSIYGWRKADIFTYFRARTDVQHRYTMNRNFRSNRRLIDAMNAFFLPIAGFDTFGFAGSAESIEYVPVEAPAEGDKPYLYCDGTPVVPLCFSELPNKPEVRSSVCAQVDELLYSGRYTIVEGQQARALRNSDIGILVRSNKDGIALKELLGRRGIMAVTISEDKVLQSDEARELRYLLAAMERPGPSEINRALLCSLTGISRILLLQLNEEKVGALFREYNRLWQEDGVYTALMRFMADFGVREYLLRAENGERILTNFVQAVELAHKYQSSRQCSLAELLGWLQRVADGMEVEGDEYEQRVESDEDAVKILTIHKSKGLQYPIVIAPTLDFTDDNALTQTCTFRDPTTAAYIFAARKELSEEQKGWLREQTEQENRRLLYVAITRAALACFIYRNTYYRQSTLATFFQALATADPSLIAKVPAPVLPEQKPRAQEQVAELFVPLQAPHFGLQEVNWRRMSYSALSAAAHALPKPPARVDEASSYDHFVYRELPRGAHTGNLLHFLFEHIRFDDESGWDRIITEAVRRYFPQRKEDFAPLLKQLLQEVLQAQIGVNGTCFSMQQVGWQQRIHELEFDFPVGEFWPGALDRLATAGMEIHTKDLPRIQGIMNGKVDLFFEFEGRYYVLDWKSNYLGDRAEDYHPSVLGQAMSEHNYHLQYLVYTAAACRYLQQRLVTFDYDSQFGGVVYLFVRGNRAGQEGGVFTARPSKTQIEALEAVFSGNTAQPEAALTLG